MWFLTSGFVIWCLLFDILFFTEKALRLTQPGCRFECRTPNIEFRTTNCGEQLLHSPFGVRYSIFSLSQEKSIPTYAAGMPCEYRTTKFGLLLLHSSFGVRYSIFSLSQEKSIPTYVAGMPCEYRTSNSEYRTTKFGLPLHSSFGVHYSIFSLSQKRASRPVHGSFFNNHFSFARLASAVRRLFTKIDMSWSHSAMSDLDTFSCSPWPVRRMILMAMRVSRSSLRMILSLWMKSDRDSAL